MNRKQILCISLLAFSLCACQDDDTADILDAFGTPPALTKMTAQEFLDQGEQMFEDGESVDEIVSADRAFYVNNPLMFRWRMESSGCSTAWRTISRKSPFG